VEEPLRPDHDRRLRGQSAQLGWITFLGFLALVSVSLGVLNLLPIPLLDGGHLVYYFAEIVKGSPVSERRWKSASVWASRFSWD
jgi:regulator of sigma E protease